MKRQGDILIEKISTMPEGNFVKVNSGIVALGEFSGHHHKLQNAILVKPEERNNNEQDSVLGYSIVEKDAMLVHQEHNKIDLEPGVYKFSKQREFDGRASRAVHD